MKNRFRLSGIVLGLVVALSFGCSSKKKVEDQNLSDAGPAVESTPIGFDSLGSDSGKIQGLNSVYFEYDKSTLTSSSASVLNENATWLKANPSVTLQVEGHCDARGSVEYNLALGERRAKSVKAFLVKSGVAESRLSIVSYGKERPLIDAETEEAYSKNRRANFVPLK